MNCQKHLTFFYLYNKLTNKRTGNSEQIAVPWIFIIKRNTTHTKGSRRKKRKKNEIIE